MTHSWQGVGAPIQSLDGSNSEYLMQVKVPLNRVILRYRILEAGLRTSRGQSGLRSRSKIQVQIQVQIQVKIDPNISDLNNIL